ncbi:unnamed protein product, partial [Durusdinium trenchii]
ASGKHAKLFSKMMQLQIPHTNQSPAMEVLHPQLQLDLQTGGSLDTFYDQHPDLVDWWETAIE